MRHETRVTVDAPAAAVWETVAAVERWSDWTPTVTAGRRLDDGPLRVGSRAEMRQPGQPRRTWTVTALTPGRAFTWRAGNPLLRMTADHVVSTVDGQTEVVLTFALAGPLAPLVAPLTAKAIRESVDTEGRSLRAHCAGTSHQDDPQPR